MLVSLCCCLSTGTRQSFRPQAYLLFRPRSLSIPLQRAIDQGEIPPALVSLLVSVKEARHAARFHSRLLQRNHASVPWKSMGIYMENSMVPLRQTTGRPR